MLTPQHALMLQDFTKLMVRVTSVFWFTLSIVFKYVQISDNIVTGDYFLLTFPTLWQLVDRSNCCWANVSFFCWILFSVTGPDVLHLASVLRVSFVRFGNTRIPLLSLLFYSVHNALMLKDWLQSEFCNIKEEYLLVANYFEVCHTILFYKKVKFITLIRVVLVY